MTDESFWLDDYRVLFEKEKLAKFVPAKNMRRNERLNALARLSIYISFALIVFNNSISYLYIAILGLLLTIFLHKRSIVVDDKESFVNTQIVNKTAPTIDNPFMNANLITDDRKRPEAKTSHNDFDLRREIEDKFGANLYRSVSDVFDKHSSQRQYYTMPATTIPNQQTSFAKWLYTPTTDDLCKTNSTFCAPTY